MDASAGGGEDSVGQRRKRRPQARLADTAWLLGAGHDMVFDPGPPDDTISPAVDRRPIRLRISAVPRLAIDSTRSNEDLTTPRHRSRRQQWLKLDSPLGSGFHASTSIGGDQARLPLRILDIARPNEIELDLMVFSSITFLFYFLPIFFLLYFAMPFKNAVLLVASLVFYAWGETVYVLLLLLCIAINYVVGLWISGARSRDSGIPLMFGIVLNLSIIGYFKYSTFIVDSVGMFVGRLGIAAQPGVENHLPLGISFFTFQAISYLIDVHRGDAPAARNPLSLAMYISMFPQLIAGPIVRFKSVAGEIDHRQPSIARMQTGIRIFVIGLAQKVLIANTVAVTADQVFGLPVAALTTSLSWLGITCYTLQIYFDFAGYSNMAIGLGHMLGFTFPRNFNYPYISQSITEFWRRWHISLSAWFRDYLYIPLGGSRISPIRTYANLLIVFLLCGLWHGASWTFVLWGLYHGLFLILERAGLGKALKAIARPLRTIYALLVVMIGWVLFRSETLDQCGGYLTAMAGFGQGDPLVQPLGQYLSASLGIALLVGIPAATPVLPALRSSLARAAKTIPWRSRIATVLLGHGTRMAHGLFLAGALTLSALSIAGGSYNPFIYFRF